MMSRKENGKKREKKKIEVFICGEINTFTNIQHLCSEIIINYTGKYERKRPKKSKFQG